MIPQYKNERVKSYVAAVRYYFFTMFYMKFTIESDGDVSKAKMTSQYKKEREGNQYCYSEELIFQHMKAKMILQYQNERIKN